MEYVMSTPKLHALTHIFLHHIATIFHKLSIRAQIFDLDHGQSTIRAMLLGHGQGKVAREHQSYCFALGINIFSPEHRPI
jgi:hypothetical protein